MTGRIRWNIISFTLAIALVATGCSRQGEVGQVPPVKGRSCDSAAPSTDKCQVVLVQLAQGVSLDEADALAEQFEGTPLAVWRTDAVCVAGVSGGGGSGTTAATSRQYSQFAYWNADEVVAKQNAEAPPATDGGYSSALRERFAEEWSAATEPNVKFAGVAFYVPKDEKLAGEKVAKTTTAESYETDDTGVLYLRGHEAAFEELFSLPSGTCS